MVSMLTATDLNVIARRALLLTRTHRRRSSAWRAARQLAANCANAADPSSPVRAIAARNVAECAAAVALMAWVKASCR